MEANHIIDFSDKLYKIILAIIGLVAVFVFGQLMYQFRALPQNAPHEISVSGESRAYAKPDVALISLGLVTQAQKSQDAVNKNNSQMNEIVKGIKDLGVEDKDIQTTLYSLYPVYGTEPIPISSGVVYSYPRPSNKIAGYSLNQEVQVKIRNFDKINSILDAAVSKGANMAGSLQFTVDDMEKVRAEARAKAIAKAKEKAVLLFSQAGLRVEKLVNISEGQGPAPIPLGGGYAGVAMEKSIAPEIQSGQVEVNSTVTLTYRVK